MARPATASSVAILARSGRKPGLLTVSSCTGAPSAPRAPEIRTPGRNVLIADVSPIWRRSMPRYLFDLLGRLKGTAARFRATVVFAGCTESGRPGVLDQEHTAGIGIRIAD